MKIINFILALVFLVFAFLQVNDADPVVWILIYGSMALVSIMAMFNVYSKKLLIVLAALCLVYCYFLLPDALQWLKQENKSIIFDTSRTMEFSFISEARKFLELLICMIVLVFNFIRSFRIKVNQNNG